MTRPRYLFVVSRRHPELFELLTERFEGDRNVEIVLDRRATALPASDQYPEHDRRRTRSAAYDLNVRSHLIITRAD